MEKGLRECCRSVRIGKMLLVRDEDTGERHVRFFGMKSFSHEE